MSQEQIIGGVFTVAIVWVICRILRRGEKTELCLPEVPLKIGDRCPNPGCKNTITSDVEQALGECEHCYLKRNGTGM